MTMRRERSGIRTGERFILIACGLVLATAGFGSPVAALASAAGWMLVIASVGLVELAMALWYRYVR